MLNYNSLTAAIALADKLEKKGVQLKAITGTPLATLISAGYLPNPDVGSMEMSAEERIQFGSVSKNAQGVCEHDLVMDEVVEVLKRTVTWGLDLARNQVNPCVHTTVQFIEDYTASAMTLKNTAISVRADTYHSIWGSHYLQGMIERYNETAVKDIKMAIAVPLPENMASPTALIETGITRFNTELTEFVATLPENYITSLYNKLFVTQDADYNPSLLSHLNHLYVEPNQVLLIHLMALKLLEVVPEGIRASLNDYKEYVSDIIAQSGRALVRILERREAAAKRKVLINDWTQYREDDIGVTPIVIRVNGDIYGTFLEAGGSPEVLFGAFLTDRNYNYDMLLERKDQYVKVWESQERVMNTNLRLQKANHYLTGLVRGVEQQIAALPDDLLVTERSIYVTSLHAYVKDMPNNWYEDCLFTTCRKVICNVMFPHTDALEILTMLDTAAKENPTLDLREAGLLAMIEYIPNWVATLITADRVNPAA
jgi:hypothetical protein